MKNAAVIIGNSSAGVREAPFLGIPSLDIGTRQTNRAEAPSLFFLPSAGGAGIAEFLGTQWGKRYPSHEAFGEGNASARFVKIVSDPTFWEGDLQKSFYDGD
jgi:UDP-N-acetylglucosamine 2-epimerase (hydrolysing)